MPLLKTANRKPKINGEAVLKFPPPGQPLISYRGVSKAFNDNVVLDGVDLDILCGETLALLGRSGSGKSVLTSMLVGLHTPDSGSLKLAGVELTELTQESRWNPIRLNMGYLFQGSALYDYMSVGDNVAFPLIQHHLLPLPEVEAKVRHLLSQVGLEGVEDLEPADLSGGMQRRVALARTLATDPKIIIYDEPTSGLDPITSDGIAHLIRELQTSLGVTSIVVTHDLRLTRQVADRLAMLCDGKIIFQGALLDVVKSTHPEIRSFIAGTALEYMAV